MATLTVVSPLLHVGGESAQLQELVVASRRAAAFYSDRGYATTAD